MVPTPHELSENNLHAGHGRSYHIDQSPSPSHKSDSPSLSNEIAKLSIVTDSGPAESMASHSQPDVIVTSETSVLHLPATDVVLSATTETSYDELETPLSAESPHRNRPPKVRFRSRVRITSGLNHQKSTSHSEQNYLTFSDTSSISGSSSSSISAPLRNHADDEVGKPGWGTLGQRVSLFAKANSRRKSASQRILSSKALRNGISITEDGDSNERTPLTLRLHESNDFDNVAADEHSSDYAREMGMRFGPWPNRLINHHWWWWYLEPIVCCHCLDESDDEG